MGEPVRAEQLGHAHLGSPDPVIGDPPQRRIDGMASQTVPFGPLPPVRQQGVAGGALLRLAGGQGRDLRRCGGAFPASFELGHDLPPSPRELLDHRTGKPDDVGHPVADRLPVDPEPAGQLRPQHGLVEVGGGLRLPVHQPAIQRPPPAARVHEVGDQNMGVQQRVPGPAGAMPEHRRHQPLALHHFAAARTSAGHARMPLQIGHALADRQVMGGGDLPGHVRGAEGVEQRDGLRGPERQIEPRCPPPRSGQGLPVRGAAGEDRTQIIGRHLPAQAEQPDPGTDPDAGRLTRGQVVVLHAVRDLGQVVLLPARRQLPNAHHIHP